MDDEQRQPWGLMMSAGNFFIAGVKRLTHLFMFIIGNHDRLPEAWKAVAKVKFDSDRAYREGSRRANAELQKILAKPRS